MLFETGKVVVTARALHEIGQEQIEFALRRHIEGDWGEGYEEDKKHNDIAVKVGARILSVYKTIEGKEFWIITEADRSITTVLLPDEY